MATSSTPSATERAMDAQLARMPAGTPRHEALLAARRFKASWVALGEQLSSVQKEQLFRAWGYEQFASYCRQELHIREETARKLTRSYAYLAEHAPSHLASRDLSAPAPPLEVVDLLRAARGRTRIDADAWQAVQDAALAPAEGASTRQQVLERLRAADPATFGPTAAGPAGNEGAVDEPSPLSVVPEPAEVDPRHARKVLLLAERLGALLREQPALAGVEHRAAVDELTRSLRKHAAIEAAGGAPPPAVRAPAGGSVSELYPEGRLH